MDDPRERVEQALSEAEGYVARMPATAGSRELKARLDGYRRALQSWSRSRPSDEQVDALVECVAEVNRIARVSAPTVRKRITPV